jgi:hypothetical protein
MEDTDMTWRTSTYSSNGGGECVEVASQAGRALVRDTKDRDGGTLALSAGAWKVFTSKIRNALQRDPIEGEHPSTDDARPLCVLALWRPTPCAPPRRSSPAPHPGC